jgi:uncharacterized repeat protein (TIGR03803 family)
VSIIGTEYLWAFARIAAVVIAAVPATAFFINLRRSTPAPPVRHPERLWALIYLRP